MNYVGRLLSNFKGFYNEINSATLTGAIDVIIVKREDGTYVSSPFHVRFGKMGVLQPREKVVDMEINGEPVDLHMKLGEAGEAFFVQEENYDVPQHLATSPIPSAITLEMMEAGLENLHLQSLQEQHIHEQQYVMCEDRAWKEAIATGQVLPVASESMPAMLPSGPKKLQVLPAVSDAITPPPSLNVETDVGTQTGTPPMSPKMSKDSSLNNFGSLSSDGLPKKDSQTSLYHSVHTSFDHASDDDSALVSCKMSIEDLQAEAESSHTRKKQFLGVEDDRKSNMSTQTDMTGEEVVATVAKSSTSSLRGVTSSDESMVASPPTSMVALAQEIAAIESSSPVAMKSDVVSDGTKLSGSPTSSRTKIASQKKKRRKKIERKRREMHLRDTVFCNVDETNEGDTSSVDGGQTTLDNLLFDMDLSADDSIDELMTMSRTVSMPIIDDCRRRSLVGEWASSHHASAFHPFSDGDITPIMSPIGTRPPSPKSDTEFETNQQFDAVSQTFLTGDQFETIDEVKWKWGELPESTPRSAKCDNDNNRDEMKVGGLFNFMRKTKKVRHQPEQEGIYLDDLNLEEMDPEVAALYIYHPKRPNGSQMLTIKDEDNESGRGGSLPQSPLSHEHQLHDSGMSGSSSTDHQQLGGIAMSLCGGLKECEVDLLPDKFTEMQVTIESFSENPSVINNPNLVVRIDNKYYNWQIAGPIIMASLAFGRPLPQVTIDSLIKQHMPKTVRRRGWIWWRTTDDTTSVGLDGKKLEDLEMDSCTVTSNVISGPIPRRHTSKERNNMQKSLLLKDSRSPSMQPESPKWILQHANDIVHHEMMDTDEVVSEVIDRKIFTYRKSLKLTSEQIEKLHLVDGVNDVCFSVTTQYQGTSRCVASIYLWNWDDRIIISDIDGTITKSDVLGQILPMVGKDWSQAGIAHLYNEIHCNGYKFLYLSARAIGQSKITRDYLRGVQQGKVSLPDGPLLLSPSSLISAFHREVIERKPEEFKISCLRDISALFPSNSNPFYAGFGNKINDVWAYRAMGIPITRIFTVNHKGELKMELTHAFQSSYTKLSDIADHFFPPLVHKDPSDGNSAVGQVHAGNFPASEEFSTFTYWREPLLDIGDELDDFKVRESPSS